REPVAARRRLTPNAFGFIHQAGSRATGGRYEEKPMGDKAIGAIVTLILSLLAVPRAAAAPPAGQGWRRRGLCAGPGRGIDEAFRQGLRDLGYVEGQNLTIEFRYAEGHLERLPELAAELVCLPVDILVTAGENAARVAQQATHTIPIVLAAGQ